MFSSLEKFKNEIVNTSEAIEEATGEKPKFFRTPYGTKLKNTYKEVGGYPGLDMQYTVFGQTFEGQEVVKKIASCPKSSEMSSTGEKSTPDPEVILEKVEIVNY